MRLPDLEEEPSAVGVTQAALEGVRLVGRALGVQQLLEPRVVALVEELCERMSLDLRGGPAEQRLDGGALIGDDAVLVEDGDQVGRVGDERAEARLALLAVQV